MLQSISKDHIELSLEQSLDYCIKCNICTASCPVAAVTDKFPGPKYVGPQAQRFRRPEQPSPDASVDYCSGCRVCNEVCPTGVKIAELNARARAKIVAEHGLPLRNRLIGRSELLGKLACGPLAPLANFTLHNGLLRLLIERVLGIARHAPLPSFSTYSFRSWFKRRVPSITGDGQWVMGDGGTQRHSVMSKSSFPPTPNPSSTSGEGSRSTSAPLLPFSPGERGGRKVRGSGRRSTLTWPWQQSPLPIAYRPSPKGQVVYFHGCATNYYEPHVGKAAVAVLEHNGFDVILAKQNCCGLPLLSNGDFKAGRQYHEANIRKLLPYARQGIPIVGTSTSCTLTLKEEAPELLGMHSDDVRLVAEHTYDIFEFLRGLADEGTLATDFVPLDRALPYHPPCQLRAHRIGLPARDVLELVPGLRIEESYSACCGIAGTYGLKKEKYQIGMDVGAGLFDFMRLFDQGSAATDSPEASLCDSETCRWQITHGSGVPTQHPIELLAKAYGLEKF